MCNLDRFILRHGIAKGINKEVFFIIETGEYKIDECGLIFFVEHLCPVVEIIEGEGNLHGFVVAHGRGKEVDAEGKGKKTDGLDQAGECR